MNEWDRPKPDDGGPAFPNQTIVEEFGGYHVVVKGGMSLRQHYAGQALANPEICTGTTSSGQLTQWFGPHRTGISRAEICARQALEYADALIAACKRDQRA